MSGIWSDNGWLEASIAWEVCASLHRQYCKGKDALFTTRQSDFVKHAENARGRAAHGQAYPTIDDLCARIKAADDAAADRDYMLDSNDCIAVLRGEWKGPLTMDKPERASHGQAPAGAVPLDDARRLFDAGWKAAALFCDREDVVADGIIGFGACPQFEAAFSAAHGIKGG